MRLFGIGASGRCADGNALHSWNHGQACCAGSRIFVHAKIYDQFLALFTERTKGIKLGDPFGNDTYQGPQVSQQQYDVRTCPSVLVLI